MKKNPENKFLSTKIIPILASLSAISAVVQLIHLGYLSPQWGMWIDVVAVTWIVAFFLFGIRGSVVVSLVGALIITLFAPDTWLGAVMKWTATMPIWITFFLWLKITRQALKKYSKFTNLLVPLILGIVFRCIIIIPLNYYFAIPIWTGLSTAKAISVIPWFVIAGFNIVQAVLDVVIAWVIVFRFGLNRYSSWDQ